MDPLRGGELNAAVTSALVGIIVGPREQMAALGGVRQLEAVVLSSRQPPKARREGAFLVAKEAAGGLVRDSRSG